MDLGLRAESGPCWAGCRPIWAWGWRSSPAGESNGDGDGDGVGEDDGRAGSPMVEVALREAIHVRASTGSRLAAAGRILRWRHPTTARRRWLETRSMRKRSETRGFGRGQQGLHEVGAVLTDMPTRRGRAWSRGSAMGGARPESWKTTAGRAVRAAGWR